MTDIKAKLLKFGAKQKNEEILTSISVRKDDVRKAYEILKKMGIHMSMKDFFTFAINHIQGGK